MRRTIAIAALTCLLGACSAANHDDAPASAATIAGATTSHDSNAVALGHFESTQYGFRIDYPAVLHASPTFDTSYLANGTWKTYADTGSTGEPVLSLTLPESNKITAGELRIGVSDDAEQVKQCREPPATLRPGSVGKANVNGIDFAHFDAGDAAMSHYLSVHSYRTVHADRCYAIDLLVIGTRPEVYDPPATPPFTHDEAFARLYKALQGLRFTSATP